MSKPMISGCMTAMVTPFKNGKLDVQSFEKLIERQIDTGIYGLILNGTTGESPTPTDDEKKLIITMALQICGGKLKVWAGTGTNNTATSIEHSKKAEALGVDGIMVVAPYYNKPSQEGLYQHYKAIHDSTNLPLILYNTPGRTGVNVSDDTLVRLSALKNFIGVKDSTGDLARPISLRKKLNGTPLTMLTGDDDSVVQFCAGGGNGIISAASNILPKECAQIAKLCNDNDFKRASAEHLRLIDFIHSLFCESNPAPTKYALSLLGLMSDEIRLPMSPLSDNSKDIVKKNMHAIGLL